MRNQLSTHESGTRETHAITTKSSTYPILNTRKIMFATGVVPLVRYTTVTVSLRSDDRFVSKNFLRVSLSIVLGFRFVA